VSSAPRKPWQAEEARAALRKERNRPSLGFAKPRDAAAWAAGLRD